MAGKSFGVFSTLTFLKAQFVLLALTLRQRPLLFSQFELEHHQFADSRRVVVALRLVYFDLEGRLFFSQFGAAQGMKALSSLTLGAFGRAGFRRAGIRAA